MNSTERCEETLKKTWQLFRKIFGTKFKENYETILRKNVGSLRKKNLKNYRTKTSEFWKNFEDLTNTRINLFKHLWKY